MENGHRWSWKVMEKHFQYSVCCKWLSRFNAKEYPRDGQDIGLALYLDYGQDLSAAF